MTDVFYRDPDQPFADNVDVRAEDYSYIASVEGDLEDVFRKMNAVDGTEIVCALGVRSMSVGDIALTDDGAYLCDRVGWRKVGDAKFELALQSKAEQAEIDDESEDDDEDDLGDVHAESARVLDRMKAAGFTIDCQAIADFKKKHS
jgi:hypothetical protein